MALLIESDLSPQLEDKVEAWVWVSLLTQLLYTCSYPVSRQSRILMLHGAMSVFTGDCMASPQVPSGKEGEPGGGAREDYSSCNT